MEINDVFNRRRFWMVLKNDLRYNWKVRLLIITLLELIIPTFSLFVPSDTLKDIGKPPYYHYGLIVVAFVGLFFSTHSFVLKIQNTALSLHSLPASIFEKYLSNFLMVTIGYTCVAIVIVLSGLQMAIWSNSIVLHRILPPLETYQYQTYLPVILLLYLSLQSVYFCGGLFFKKSAFIKVSGIVFVSLYFLTFLNSSFGLPTNNWNPTAITIAYSFCLPLFFWTLAYIRLAESEGM